MRRLWFRLRTMLRRMLDGGASDEELGEEIRAFLEHDIESKIRSGMTPKDARRAALIELGGADQIKDGVREAAAGARWESVFRDIRYAVRSLGKARAFSASVIGSLSLGLVATIMAFALINGFMLLPRALPGVQDQDRLVTLGTLDTFGPRLGLRRTTWTDYPDVVRTLDGMTSLEDVASFTESDVAVTLPQPVSLPAAFVSPDYFDVLGVRAEIGRNFAPEEGGAEFAVAIISHALWTQELGGDPSVIGRPIQVGRQPFEIIGVAPQGFAGTTRGTDVELWVPIVFADLLAVNSRSGTGSFMPGELGEWQIRYVGRMRDGVSVGRVETELGVVAGGIVASAANPTDPAQPVRVEVSGLGESDAGGVLEAAGILVVPFLVLAIGCVNAANLLLVRATRRRREVAVRLALGASRLRLVRQLVIESVILALGAVLVALPFAWWCLQWLAAVFVFPVPLDGTVVAGALVTAFVTALAFGLVPALQATGQRPSAALGTAHAGSGGTRSQARGRRALVAGQVALSLGLLGTAFQLTSALESVAEPPAADPDRVLLASFDLAQLRFSAAESDAFYAALLDGASRLPGVAAAALSNRNLDQGWEFWGSLAAVTDEPDVPFSPLVVSASAGGDYFEVVGLDLVRGREFVAPDRRDIADVAIVTDRLAAQIFDDADALGRSVYVSTVSAYTPAKAVLRIVGVVESPVRPSGEEVAAIFFPSPLEQGTALTLHVRSEGPAAPLAPAVRDLVTRLDPNVPILELATLEQKIRVDDLDNRMLARVVALLGIVAVLLASMGLYGVTSYSVASRAQEIAVRMALGAEPAHVQAMVLRQALSVAVIGSVLGGLAAIAIGVLIRAEIVDVAGVDVAALGGSAALLAAAMLLASLVPARRAARLAPYAVLREE